MLKFYELGCHLPTGGLKIGKHFHGVTILYSQKHPLIWSFRNSGTVLESLNLPDVKPEPRHPVWTRDPKSQSHFPREYINLFSPVRMRKKGIKVCCLQISTKLNSQSLTPNFSHFPLIQPQTVTGDSKSGGWQTLEGASESLLPSPPALVPSVVTTAPPSSNM